MHVPYRLLLLAAFAAASVSANTIDNQENLVESAPIVGSADGASVSDVTEREEEFAIEPQPTRAPTDAPTEPPIVAPAPDNSVTNPTAEDAPVEATSRASVVAPTAFAFVSATVVYCML
uniref:Uncharacterized protein n=1 Tax=Peronospora matthiolae TaxID=2874970 RepID=A0AAV1TFC7_9STRA